MKNIVFIIICSCFSFNVIHAQVLKIWKNGVMTTYVDAPDSLTFEENIDWSKFPIKLSSISYSQTETDKIFTVETSSIVDNPISNYGWEISNDSTFSSVILAKEINDANITYSDNVLRLSLPNDYVINSLCNKYIRAYASYSSEMSYSQHLYVSDEFLGLKWDGQVNSEFSGGEGTVDSPYLIANGGDFALLSKYSDKFFRLIADIDLNNKSWTPIAKFSGTLDGNNKVVKNLYIEQTGNNIGLFKITSPQSSIKNLSIENVNIHCPNSSYVGVFAGVASGNYLSCNVNIGDGTIEGNEHVGGMFGQILHDGSYKQGFSIDSCTVTSNSDIPHIIGNSIVGGFAGSTSVKYYNYLVNISNAKVSTSIKGKTYIGGLLGKLQSFVYLDRSHSKCSISGEQYLGGIGGEISTTVESKSQVSSSISDCTIEGDNYIGGFAGYLGCFPIVSSYTKGKIVSSGNYVGGFFGYDKYIYQSSTEIECCYSAMDIPSQIAGFSGYVDRSIIYQDCYTNSSKYYNEKGSGWSESSKVKNCKYACQGSDIIDGFSSSTSSFATNWNLTSTWIWNGDNNGVSVSLSCPKLTWEK